MLKVTTDTVAQLKPTTGEWTNQVATPTFNIHNPRRIRESIVKTLTTDREYHLSILVEVNMTILTLLNHQVIANHQHLMAKSRMTSSRKHQIRTSTISLHRNNLFHKTLLIMVE